MLDGVPIGDLTAPGLLLIVVVLVLLGWLVPKRLLDRADRETGYWRATTETLTQTIAQQSQQLEQLVELAKTANSVLTALPTRDRDTTS